MSEHDPGSEETIFSTALHCAPGERAPYLDEACAGQPALRQRIEELLKAQPQLGEFLENQADIGTPGAPETVRSTVPPEERPGTRIGRYKLLQKIGEGGCGVVYMAEQEEPVRRRVALKVIKLGMDTKSVIARFEAERQALAMMDHPNIAKVLDGCATETGRPYFVMELVRGIKITEFCDQNRLPTRERLDLFIQVCQAVQHAHQKGIIHRDLKPSNILVTLHDPGAPGVPMIIDFGIAKATQGRLTDQTFFTAFEQFLGTPAYMSPEQAMMTALDIDTRSDIYSLGVLLYELLTGRTPFDAKELLAAGFEGMRRTIREKEPLRPSTRLSTLLAAEQTAAASFRQTEPPKLVHLVRGDLDWIVMKCLEKDRARRYETANGLAKDLERHLNSEPVLARPPSRLYSLQKLYRRNRRIFAAGVLVLVVGILGGAGVLWQWQRARALAVSEAQARQRAEAEAFKVRQNLYVADISVVQRKIEEGDIGLARDLLETHDPKPGQPDLRGFEWRYFWGRCKGDEVSTLGQGDGYYLHLSLSPDESLLAYGRKLWNLQTGMVYDRLPANESVVAFAPQGQVLLVNDQAHGFSRRDLHTGKEWLLAPDEKVIAVGFSATGRWMATGRDIESGPAGIQRNLSLWDTTTWKRIAMATNIVFDSRLPRALAFSPDEKLLISASGYSLAGEGRLRVFRVPSLEPVPMAASGTGYEGCVVFSPDGREFFTGDWNGDVRVWDARSLRELEERRRVGHHRTWIGAMAFSPGTSKLLSTSADRCLRVWDPYGRAPVTTLRGHSTEINGLAIARNGRTAYTAAADGALKQWHPLAGPRTDLLPVTASSIHLSGLSADSQTVASVADGTLILTKLGNEHNEASATPTGFTNLPCFPSSIGFSSGLAVVSPNLAWLAVARTNAPLEVWELAHHTRRFWGPPLGSAVHAVFSPDSLFLAFARETNVVLLDVATGTELVASVSCPEGWSWPFRFAGKTNVLGIGCGRRIMLWDTHEQRVLQEVTLKHRAHAICFALSADAQQLAVGYTDNSFTLHDTRTGEQQGQAVPAHLSGVTFLCFSPDGRTLVSTTQRSLKFWNLATRRELAAFELPGMTKAIAFTPDGNNLVAETGGTLCAWRAPSGADIEADQRQRNKTAR